MGPEFVKRLLSVLATILFFFIPVSALATDGAKAHVLESIEVIAGNDKPEQVVFKFNGAHTPRYFRLNGKNPRLVFDFYGVKYPSETTNFGDVGGDIIAGIRVGRHFDPQKTRVVVDIQLDSPYFHEQTFNVSTNNLVVTLIPDLEEESAPAEASPQPPRIEVDTTKVIHSPSKESTEPEKDQPATEDKEKPQEAEDSKKEPTEDAAVDTAEVAEQPPAPSPDEGEADEATASTVADQPAEEVAEDQETQPEVAEQPTSPQEAPVEDIEPVLLDVSFEKSINDSETVLFRLNHFYPPLVFGIEKGEPRVVCDFIDASIDPSIPPVIEADGQFVDRIMVTNETDPDKVRVELVLMPNRNYDLQQLFFKEDNLFVVIVKELQ